MFDLEDAAQGFYGDGLYVGVPERDYHTRKFGYENSISSTELKRFLVDPNEAYYYRHIAGEQSTSAFDFGHAVHEMILGVGLGLVRLPYDDLRRKEAKEAVAQARAEGKIPLKAQDYDLAEQLANNVLNHPVGEQLFNRTAGVPEVSAYCKDDHTGLELRGRFDWLTTREGKPCIVDVKTTASTGLARDFERDAAKYDYPLQREFYRHMYRTITGETPDFLHVIVSKQPPYNVTVVSMDFLCETAGQRRMAFALDQWATWDKNDWWMKPSRTIEWVSAPQYYLDESDNL